MSLEIPGNMGGNPQLVAMLENLLRDAKAGRISTAGVAIVSPLGQINVTVAGGQATEVYFAADLLKEVVKNAMTQGGARPLQMVS